MAPPFCLTSVGAVARLRGSERLPGPEQAQRHDDDINCCATHNSFTEPAAGSALQVAERDLGADGVVSADDHPETLIADGRASGGRIIKGSAFPKLGRTVCVEVVRGKVFVRRPGRRRFVECPTTRSSASARCSTRAGAPSG